jgi:GT2 family glycosyltransferase
MSVQAGSAPVSVVVPTIGRPQLLRQCLASLDRCDAPAAEVVVVDQSGNPEVGGVVQEFAEMGARLVASRERGVAWARNLGLASSRNDVVLFTDDDCTVAASWIGTAWELMNEDRERIVTGQVLPHGDPDAVPSLRDGPRTHDHTGELECAALYTGNAALSRTELLAFGGFDDRFESAGEDLDLCYRWLRSGRRLLYEPRLVVWHHDWRAPDQLEELDRRYWRAHGAFYAKHLRRHDLAVARFLARDARGGLRLLARWPREGESAGRKPIARMAGGLAGGFAEGWRKFA